MVFRKIYTINGTSVFLNSFKLKVCKWEDKCISTVKTSTLFNKVADRNFCSKSQTCTGMVGSKYEKPETVG